LLSDPVPAADIGAELPTHRFRVCRDEDFFDLEFSFINFELRDHRLLALGHGSSSVVVRFPPQNLAEAIFDEVHQPASDNKDKVKGDDKKKDQVKDDDKKVQFENDPIEDRPEITHGNPPAPPINCYLSGPSWLVFQAPDRAELPCGPGGNGSVIDEWVRQPAEWNLRVPAGAAKRATPAAPRADKSKGVTPSMPRANETCIEVPFRLFIAPASLHTRWRPSGARQGRAGGFREVWHAALLSGDPVTPAGLPPELVGKVPPELEPPRRVVLQARAFYPPDCKRPKQPQPPFNLYYPADQPLSLHSLTRHRLVKQMSEGDGWIDAENLILSALGAHASLFYASQKKIETIIQEQRTKQANAGTELRLWKHRVVVGRDVFFAEAFFGFLFPFRHEAVYVEVTQRRFAARQTGGKAEEHGPPGAYLLKRRFILVVNQMRQFADSRSALGRAMPLKKVVLKMLRSPDLVDPALTPVKKGLPGQKGALLFWPTVLTTGAKVDWEIECEDESRQKSTTTKAHLVFADHILDGHRLYAADPDPDPILTVDERTIPFPGSKIAYAPEVPQLRLPRPGQVGEDVRHVLQSAERAAAAKLGKSLRDEWGKLVGQGLDEAVKALQKKVAELDASSYRDLRAETLTAVQEALGKAREWYNTTIDDLRLAVDTVLGQLENAERVAASLETQAITFLSHNAGDLLKAADNLAKELPNQNNLDDFLKRLKAQALSADVVAKVEKEARALFDVAGGRWEEAKERIGGYLAELKAARDKAEKVGSDIFHAVVQKAATVIPALKAIAPGVPVRDIQLFEDYLAGGIATVQRGVYAKLTEAITEGNQLAQQIKNGIARPAAAIAGLSRELGALVSDGEGKLKELARKFKDKIDLGSALPDAKLFGVIPLRQILESLGHGQVPNINLIELPDKIERVWEWTAPVKRQEFGILTFEVPAPDVRLYIKFTTTLLLPRPGELAAGSAPAGRVALEGFLGGWDENQKKPKETSDTTFAINLLDLIRVDFRQLRFQAEYATGQQAQPRITPGLNNVEFLGPLRFIREFQKRLGNLGGGFRLELTAEHVGVSFQAAVPPISFGVFSLRGIAIGSALRLPLTERALRYEFNFSTWEKPFELSIMGFSGRGFFSAALESSGVRELQGAFEFGGSLSFDVGVASGGLYVMAGAYFRMTQSTTELSGYLRAGGNLNVLGLIHANVEFLLMIRFRRVQQENQLHGMCRITVSIDLFMFSLDVSIEMEKQIAGSQGGSDRAIGRRADQLPEAAVRPGEPRPRPYFTRSAELQGRFPNRLVWERDYWTQFDYSTKYSHSAPLGAGWR
jgi:hypothetical protein